MKLAYVNLLLLDSVGTENKYLSQSKAASKAGIDMDVILMMPLESRTSPNLHVARFLHFKNRYVMKILYNLAKFHLITGAFDLSSYDRIILRYPFADPTFGALFDRYPGRIITEHHADEIKELETFGTKAGRFKVVLEKTFGPLVLSRVSGIIGVTDEIRRLQLGKISTTKPSAVVSNGCDVDGVNFTSFRPFDGRTLTLIFVATHFVSWHGLDRLLDSIAIYKGSTTIRLILVGQIVYQRDIKRIHRLSKMKVQVEKRDILRGKALDECFRESNIAVGTLALHRKGIKQACTLKIRDYIARGIPFIYGYEDVDIDKNCDFAMRLEDSEEPIDIDRVIEFATTVSKDGGISDRMRFFAHSSMDWQVKLSKMYDFALTV